MPTLRPFQVIGRDFLASRSKAAILDYMGLGKTPQAITALAKLSESDRQRVLVIAPLATATGWQREFVTWGAGLRGLEILRRKDPIPGRAGIYFIAWTDLAVRLPDILASGRFDLIIADEIHRAKGGTAVKMSKAFTGAWSKSGGQWVREPGAVDHASRVWMLSGTPTPNGRPIELLPMLNSLGVVGSRGARMTRKDYEDRFCKQRNPFSPSGYDLQAVRGLDELKGLLDGSGCILRRTPEDVAGELPPLQRAIVPLLGIKDADLQDADGYIARKELPPFEEMAKYRSDMGKAKTKAAIDWLVGHAEDNGGQPLVVFCHHKAVGAEIAAALAAAGWGSVEFASGDDPPVERQAKVDRFAAPGGPLALVATMAACGTGMNGMQKRTAECVFVECAWEPATLDQAEGRIRRMGGIGAVMALAHYLVAADCLDEYIQRTVNEKRDAVWQTLDTDAGARPAPAAPALEPVVDAEALADDALPDPYQLPWSWRLDKRTQDWLVRAPVDLSRTEDVKAWIGAEVTITTAAGKQKIRKLVSMVATGAHNGGWCVWKHADPDTNGARSTNARARFHERMRRRLHIGDALALTLDAGGALTADSERQAAQACKDAARVLSELDPDRAATRNEVGWSSADGTVGRILASIDPEHYTQATLAAARRILGRYKNTQLASIAPAIWPSAA